MLILSFIIPVLLWLMAIAVCGVFPFGDGTLLISDMYVQYTWYFEFLQNILKNGIDLFYSFAYGLGSETISLIAYYLMSPLNFIVYFFSKENITEAILLINLIKIGLCGLSFGILLKVKFNKKSLVNIGFSTCYSLMAYNIVYQFNIMWLDGVILLPIIVLGIDRLFEKDKPALFYLSLLGGIITNWYIGWMLCIFSFIYVVYLVFPNLKENLKKFLKLIFVGILCAGSAMIVILPTIYSQLQVVSRKEFIIDALGNINFNVLDILSKFIVGSFHFGQIMSTESYSGFLNLPNIYCGIFITFLVVLYFINKKINKEAKIKDGLLLAIMFISVFVNAINIVWHGFSINLWFPYRYSFIISFIMIIIAYKSYWKLGDIEDKSILKVFGLIAFICCIIQKWEYEFLVDGVILVTLLILATYVFIFIRSRQRSEIMMLLNVIVCFELLINSIIVFSAMSYKDRAEIYEMEDSFNKAVENIALKDKDYFRVENDNKIASFQFGKNIMGVSSSSSTYPQKGYKLLNNLGITAEDIVRLDYKFSTMFNDTILGIKYFIGEGENSYYEEYDKENNIWINNDALSLGFMVNDNVCLVEDLFGIAGSIPDPFMNQNEIAKNLLKKGKEIFQEIEIESIKKNNLIKEDEIYYKESKFKTSSIEFELNIEEDKEVYLDVAGEGYSGNRLKLYVDNEDILGEGKYLANFNSINLGKFDVGKKINVKIEHLDSGEFPVKAVFAYYFDEEIYKDLVSELKKNQLEILDMTNSRLSGKVNVTEDKDTLLITFLYDKFIKVKVDGEEVEPFEVLDTFIGIKLTPGEHIVELWYEPTLLKVSGIISLSFILFSGIVILVWSKERKRIK